MKIKSKNLKTLEQIKKEKGRTQWASLITEAKNSKNKTQQAQANRK